MPPWRFPTNSAMRDASDLGHRLLLPFFSSFFCVSKICQIQALGERLQLTDRDRPARPGPKGGGRMRPGSKPACYAPFHTP